MYRNVQRLMDDLDQDLFVLCLHRTFAGQYSAGVVGGCGAGIATV